MSNEMWEVILSIVAPAITILLSYGAKLLTDYINDKREEIKTRVKNEKTKTYVDLVADNAMNVVQTLNQTLVQDLKAASEDGKLTKDDAILIKNNALDMLKNTLSEDIRELLGEVFGDTDVYLSNVLEKVVCQVKNMSSNG